MNDQIQNRFPNSCGDRPLHFAPRLARVGDAGNCTNPGQLFAAGWSASFLSAIKLVAGRRAIALRPESAIDAEVDLGLVNSECTLATRLNVSLPDIDRSVAQELVNAAHQICPYSRATRGNIEVAIHVV